MTTIMEALSQEHNLASGIEDASEAAPFREVVGRLINRLWNQLSMSRVSHLGMILVRFELLVAVVSYHSLKLTC